MVYLYQLVVYYYLLYRKIKVVRLQPLWLQKIKSSHQAMLMIKSTQVDFFVAIVKKGVMWYDKSRKEKNQYE